jgi:glycosyltransferase involved in cell wall biosynthesis
MFLKALFWGSLGALAWTHAGYPAATAVLARIHPRRARKEDVEPSVSLIVAAHNEETVIRQKLENLLALDYPSERLEIVVASDSSTDGTDAIVEEVASRESRVRLLRCPRAGKVAAQDRAVSETSSEIVAFSDANSIWSPDALRKLLRSFADPDVAYVCGRLALQESNGANREGLYWRYELWLRGQESLVSSITAGNGAIYAVRRSDYVQEDGRFGHDLGFPYLMVQRGRRAVYDDEAVAVEPPAEEPEDEFGRKVRIHARVWGHILSGRILRPTDPLYMAQLASHRLLRYSSGFLHLTLLGSSIALAGRGPIYRGALAAQLAGLGLALAGRFRLRVPGANLAYYYTLVTAATMLGLKRYLRSGTPVMWEKAKGTR